MAAARPLSGAARHAAFAAGQAAVVAHVAAQELGTAASGSCSRCQRHSSRPFPPCDGEADSARALRAALRRDLATVLKTRDPDALAALRTSLAAIDNAEAVPAPVANPPTTSAHVAAARSGPGSTEAALRQLSADELRDILRDQLAEHSREADRYDTLGHAAAAERLRRQGRALAAYLGNGSA